MGEDKVCKTNIIEPIRKQSGNSDFLIYPLLPTGKKNAISTEALVTLAGCRHKREMTKLIEAERKAGALICSSSSGGYFKAKNKGELAEYYHSMQSRAINIFLAIKASKRALEETEGQQGLNIREELR